jgi:hypothetical protein
VATRLLTASRKVCRRAGYRTSSLTKADRKMWIGIKTKKILHYKGSACQWFWSDCGSFDLIVIFDMVFITKPKLCFKSYPALVCCISKWVSDCSLTPSELCFSHIKARTSYISMRWYPLCTRPTHLYKLDFPGAILLKQQSAGRLVSSLGYITLIPSYQSLLLFLNVVCLLQKQRLIPIL